MRGRLPLLSLLLLLPLAARAELAVPPLVGPVVDLAGVVSGGATERLEALSRAARARDGGNGPQLQFLVVGSLQGEAIESYSMRVAEAWRLGTRGLDNGILVTVAVDDRAMRIEVGGGIEGGLTDAQAARIIRATFAPAFRSGRYGEGLEAGALEVLAAVGGLPDGIARPSGGFGPRGEPPVLRALRGGLFTFVIVVAVIVSILSRIFFGRGLRPRYGPRRYSSWGGPRIGGGFGGFGGGGGGWSGGGGGFSGGGASGRW